MVVRTKMKQVFFKICFPSLKNTSRDTGIFTRQRRTPSTWANRSARNGHLFLLLRILVHYRPAQRMDRLETAKTLICWFWDKYIRSINSGRHCVQLDEETQCVLDKTGQCLLNPQIRGISNKWYTEDLMGKQKILLEASEISRCTQISIAQELSRWVSMQWG